MIAKKGQPHTIAEELILCAVKSITTIMCGDKFTKEVSSIPLSSNTIKRQIDEMAENLNSTLIERMRSSE
jgi:hypothetical protein